MIQKFYERAFSRCCNTAEPSFAVVARCANVSEVKLEPGECLRAAVLPHFYRQPGMKIKYN